MAATFVGVNGSPSASSSTASVETLPEPNLNGVKSTVGDYADAKLRHLQVYVETEALELRRSVVGTDLEETARLVAENANAMATAFREFHRLLVAARGSTPKRDHALQLSFFWLLMKQARWLFDRARRGDERIEIYFPTKNVSFLGRTNPGWIRVLRDVVLEIGSRQKGMRNLKNDGLMPTVPSNIVEGMPEHDLFPPDKVSEYDAELGRWLDFTELEPLSDRFHREIAKTLNAALNTPPLQAGDSESDIDAILGWKLSETPQKFTKGDPFPYEYGSDLHWLWGWGQRVETLLKEDTKLGEYDGMTFRPDRLARKAMMRFSVTFPLVIKPIEDALDWTEKRFAEFLKTKRDSNYLSGLDSVRHRVATAVEIIAAEQGAKPQPKIVTPKPSNGKGMSVKVAIREGERHLDRNPWPGNNVLAKIVGCSPSTMSKAARRSVKMTKAKSDARNQSKSVATHQWSEAVGATVATADMLPELDEDVADDDVFASVLKQCQTDEERAALAELTPEERQELAAIALTHPDTGKPLKKPKAR